MSNINNEIFLYKQKPYNKDGLNVWMAFPGIYSFGMSALGFLTVFKAYDTNPDINCERIFADTKTTKISIKDVDLISFSFSFELDFLTIFKMLSKYNIPLRASERDDKFPLICAGGPVVTANPEPFAEMFDFIEVGDAENHIDKINNTLFENKNKSKKDILAELSKISGIYIPSFTKFDAEKGMLTLDGKPYTVEKTTSCLEKCVTTPILSQQAFFSNTYIIEIARGCPQRCGFCNTAYINSPYRTLPYENIIEKIDEALKYTDKIAFLGAAIAAHPRFDDLCRYVASKVTDERKIELSVSSVRADGISEEAAKALVKCGQKHATIAIEAGSENLRKKINKNLTDKQIFDVVKRLRECGFSGVKIYAMIGLPTETDEDIKAFVTLAAKLKNENKGFDISFSFTSLIPKSHTPFQFVNRESVKSLEKKFEYIKKEFHKLGIKLNSLTAKWDYIQAIFSRGGRELFEYAVAVYENGGNIGAFKTVAREFEKSGKIKSFDDIALNKCHADTITPWDFIKMKYSKEFILNEFNRLLT